jgi:pyruvate/2-oxoglutarate/acetoin dehydrogenase E1 component
MAQMNMIQALHSAMDVMLERDPNVVLMGEDIGYFGGVFRATEGLQRKVGEHRVLDTPRSAWASMDYGRSPRSSFPTTSTRHSIRS